MRVWIDQDLCTGDGLCVDHCPEIFVLLEDGISYVHYDGWIGNDPGQDECAVTVPATHERSVINAAEDCPGECIFIEIDRPEELSTS
jgi:ferredoxin